MLKGIYKKPVMQLHFEPTTDCNARCPQCMRTLLGTLKTNPNLEIKEWNPEDLDKVLDDPYFSKLLKVLVNGNYGDIVKHSRPKELLEVLFKRGYRVEIRTNGGALKTEFWTWLGKQKDVIVEFGIDGLEDTHHLYRRNTRFDVVMKNAKAYIKAGGKASWAMTVFKHNEHQVEECEQLAKDLGFASFKSRDSTRWWVKKMNAYDKNFEFEYHLEPSSRAAHIARDKDDGYDIRKETLQKRSTEKHDVDLSLFDDYKIPKIKPKEIGCVVRASHSIYIAGDGKLWPCCWTEQEVRQFLIYQETTPLAYFLYKKNKFDLDFNDLTKYSVDEILDTGFFQIIEDSWEKNKIRSCVHTCTVNSNYDKQKKYTKIKRKN